jgi:toxin ParE1/3/4
MSQYRVSDAASADLVDIWLFIAQDDAHAAARFLRKLVSRFPTLASMPDMGRRREELADRLRSFPVGNYVIFYRPMERGIEIVRVLHGARDLPALFE